MRGDCEACARELVGRATLWRRGACRIGLAFRHYGRRVLHWRPCVSARSSATRRDADRRDGAGGAHRLIMSMLSLAGAMAQLPLRSCALAVCSWALALGAVMCASASVRGASPHREKHPPKPGLAPKTERIRHGSRGGTHARPYHSGRLISLGSTPPYPHERGGRAPGILSQRPVAGASLAHMRCTRLLGSGSLVPGCRR